ncbi:MAG: hypothetical protein CVV13_08460 [Gammaproteobacteria bacterium HGW-Gammaproteobacteria-3]|nr:MAG: hypothetical protein CVV13_08460 [Gammaproteobacteria bacterium HGW-Gammaproteobacteria-3]
MPAKTTQFIKIPGPMRIVWGSLGCYWLKDMLNPGFLTIAVMLLSLIPVLVMEKYFPGQSEKTPSKNSV